MKAWILKDFEFLTVVLGLIQTSVSFQSISIDGKEIKLKFFLGGDMKFLLMITIIADELHLLLRIILLQNIIVGC